MARPARRSSKCMAKASAALTSGPKARIKSQGHGMPSRPFFPEFSKTQHDQYQRSAKAKSPVSRAAGGRMPFRVTCILSNAKVSDGGQPPVTFELSLSETAGPRSLHRLV